MCGRSECLRASEQADGARWGMASQLGGAVGQTSASPCCEKRWSSAQGRGEGEADAASVLACVRVCVRGVPKRRENGLAVGGGGGTGQCRWVRTEGRRQERSKVVRSTNGDRAKLASWVGLDGVERTSVVCCWSSWPAGWLAVKTDCACGRQRKFEGRTGSRRQVEGERERERGKPNLQHRASKQAGEDGETGEAARGGWKARQRT